MKNLILQFILCVTAVFTSAPSYSADLESSTIEKKIDLMISFKWRGQANWSHHSLAQDYLKTKREFVVLLDEGENALNLCLTLGYESLRSKESMFVQGNDTEFPGQYPVGVQEITSSGHLIKVIPNIDLVEMTILKSVTCSK